ncbi:hypothetical protein Hypma_007776 [Hypsizygus marmoreus]|uniref:F-box domain-containing protein n=1 Tax=Hypsizygus marmoreus TaxID=39966 RepID=A0A369JST4_HYPMA|nr:hypothetical protein Hypma_007776 [Hypsizygus marmoreus]
MPTSKRTLSPAPLPAAKRLHTASSAGPQPRLSFDSSLYEELILCIFSHLSWVDLCAAQATSRNWYRLAADNELWRRLYLHVFGRSRLRGSRGFVARSDGREVRPLPGRANSKEESLKDWKWMFRISSNWRKGRCSTEQLNGGLHPSLDHRPESSYQAHVLLAGPLTITASSQPADIPAINVLNSTATGHVLACESRLRTGQCHLTALAIDQSPPSHGHLRLVAFLSTGEFAIFSLNPSHLSTSSRQLTFVPNRRNARSSPATQAVYHHPLLITLSGSFSLSIYDLSDDTVRHTQTLTSFTSFPPTSLVLSTPTSSTYKLIIAYTIPVYPAHWSVGATELIITGREIPSLYAFSEPSSPSADPLCVTSTRTIRALDVPPGWIDEEKLRSMREQWSRKVSRVADIQTDGKWVVLAPAEGLPSSSADTLPLISSLDVLSMNSSTTLQLYRLSLPPASNSVASPPPKLTFVRSLHGQSGPVSSLALADGRCVSLGLNGSLWVWDLEAGTGAEVFTSSSPRAAVDSHLVKGTVAFDDRRIITAEGSRVTAHRFDV